MNLKFTNLFVGAFPKFLKTSSCLLSFRPSARMENLGFHWTDFHEILYFSILRMSVRKFKFHYNLTIVTGILQECLAHS